MQVALANPHLVGEGFDLPAVRPLFEEYVASFALQDRIRFRIGDFFKDPLPSADVGVSRAERRAQSESAERGRRTVLGNGECRNGGSTGARCAPVAAERSEPPSDRSAG